MKARLFTSTRLALAALLSGSFLVWAVATLDLDNDGMSDAWELLFQAEGLAPGDDEDGDRVTNIAEAEAGTDPYNPQSYFKVADFQKADSGITVSYDSLVGKQYLIEVSSDMSTWMNDSIWRNGTGERVDTFMSNDQRVFTIGTVTREWHDIGNSSGWGLNGFRSTESYQNNTPTESFTLSEFSFREFDPDLNSHGSRIRSYLIPHISGEYTFQVTSDDQSELFLSPTADPAEKVVIASIDGWTHPTEFDKYPSQTSASIQLIAGQVYYMELEHFESGGGDHAAVHWTGPGILREIIGGEYLASYHSNASKLIPDDTVFFRTVVRDMDSDNDGAYDFDEIILGGNPASPSSGSLSALTAALSDNNRLSISSLDSSAYESGPTPGRFLIRRDGNLNALEATVSLSGTATADDYQTVETTVSFPLGVREAIVSIIPINDGILENDEEINITLTPSTNYEISGNSSASLMIEDAAPALLIARPSPSPGTLSLAQALVTFWEKGNRSSARVSIEIANLSSNYTGARFEILSDDGSNNTTILTLTSDQTNDFFWDYGADASAINMALDSRRLQVVLLSEGEPEEELSGIIVSQAEDAASFAAPAVPPATSNGTITDAAAARFLTQSTFGPTPTTVAELISLGSYEDWIDQQMDPIQTPISSQEDYLEGLIEEDNRPRQMDRVEHWIRSATEYPDQLRQRMAFALSQILVISDEDGQVGRDAIAVAHYYDFLMNDAFGNYRDLLEKISKSPLMGYYLSHLRNRKADIYAGTNPDENYAREIMQLFSIGLVELHPDGSPKLGPDGVPIPTYDQATISEMARVFTGWSYFTEDIPSTHFMYGPRDAFNPMVNFPEFHDKDPKTVIGGLQLPGGQTGEEELDAVVDALFNHSNTAPFISRLLIQRLITSNPSPGYIYRIASVFADDGTGTRGNLGAVLKAILLDPEARNSDLSTQPGYGKAQEPLIKFLRPMRVFGHTNPSNIYRFYGLKNDYLQAPLSAPTVFNFFLPNHSPQGVLSDAGLLAPEFQIIAETSIISAANRNVNSISFNGINSFDPAIALTFDWQPFIDMYLNNPADYVDFLDLYFLSGQMPAEMRTELLDMLANITYWNDDELNLYRVSSAARIVINSPQAAIIK